MMRTQRLNWFRIGLFAGCTFLFLGCPPKREMQNTLQKTPPSPRLVVGIVVDQMRHDYLERYWDNFGKGGFKRLIGEGYNFDHCNYNYVPTETAPGHASIFTGTTPSNHGIIMNGWLDQTEMARGIVRAHSSVHDTTYPLMGFPAERILGRGASPHFLEASTIADQVKAATNGKGKTIGVSLKDRSAILPAGKSADAAFWFEDGTGNMISSSYYPAMQAGTPAWLDSINALRMPMRYLSEKAGWNLLLDASQYVSPDGPNDARYEGAYDRIGTANFPHKFRFNPLYCCGNFKSTPYGNIFLKDFAKEVIQQYELGEDEVMDFLSLSFSSTDMVAHQFGPHSREVEDTYLRLDRDLEDFLNFLDDRFGKGKVLVFLTADHGGAPNPTYAKDHGGKGGWLEGLQLHRKIRKQLGDQVGQDSLLLRVQGHTIYLNRRLAKTRNLDLDSLSQVVVSAADDFPGVRKAYTAAQIAKISAPTGPERLLKNGFYPERSGDVLYLTTYGYMQSPYGASQPWRHKKGTSHGSVYEYDTHVPLMYWGWRIPAKQSDAAVLIPDIAPTICGLLGIEAPNKSTGKATFQIEQ